MKQITKITNCTHRKSFLEILGYLKFQRGKLKFRNTLIRYPVVLQKKLTDNANSALIIANFFLFVLWIKPKFFFFFRPRRISRKTTGYLCCTFLIFFCCSNEPKKAHWITRFPFKNIGNKQQFKQKTRKKKVRITRKTSCYPVSFFGSFEQKKKIRNVQQPTYFKKAAKLFFFFVFPSAKKFFP